MEEFFGTIAAIGIITAAFFAYKGTFYPTGTQWYEACWEKSVETKKGSFSGEPIASDPYKAALWENCENISKRGIYGAGTVFTWNLEGNTDTDDLAIQNACPSLRKDVPGGYYLLVLRLLQSRGGPGFFDKFLPAETTIGATMRRSWPNCERERIRQGFSKIAEKANGRFDWEKPCVRCGAEGLVVSATWSH